MFGVPSRNLNEGLKKERRAERVETGLEREWSERVEERERGRPKGMERGLASSEQGRPPVI